MAEEAPSQSSARYSPAIFETPRTFDQAMAIAITPEDGLTTEQRMKVETPYFADLIDRHIKITQESRVLDYGCGPGRMSKEILIRHSPRVYGVDISPPMLAFAVAHTYSERFMALSPLMVDDLPSVDVIVLTWVLQHIPNVDGTLAMLMNKMKPQGRIFVVNAHDQILPVEGGSWMHSQQTNVLGVLRARLKQVAFEDHLDPEKTSLGLSQHAWWGVFESHVAWA